MARSHAGSAPRLRTHMAALVGILVLVSPLLELNGVFISDEGSYATQARALESRGWDVGYPFEEVDPDGRFVPFHASVRSADGTFAYVGHPSWPALLAGSTRVLGEQVGLRAIGVISAVVLAGTAWALARALGRPDAAGWAFWIAAAAPPLASAWVTWAHTSSAAAGALLVLGLVRAPDGVRWTMAAAAGAAVGVLLRSESLLWAGAVCAALVVVERSWRAVWSAGSVAAAAGLALVIDGSWRRAIVGPSAPSRASSATGDLVVRSEGASTGDRLEGIRLTLLDGAFGSTSAKLLAIVAAAVAFLAVWCLGTGRGNRAAGALFGVAAAVLALRIATEPDDPVPGLLLAAPALLLLGLVLRRHELRWPLLAVAFFLVGIGVTIYPEGGSLQWGGRYLSPAVSVLAVAAAVGLATALATRGDPSRWLPIGVAALLLVQAVGAIVTPDRVRQKTANAVASAVAAGPDVLVADGRQIARLDVRGWPERCWLATPVDASAAALQDVERVLRDAGVRRATYVGFEAAELYAAGADVVHSVPGSLVSVVDVGGTGPRRISEPYRCIGR